jgi:biofilm PGA synthesis lipoprotein PgaB
MGFLLYAQKILLDKDRKLKALLITAVMALAVLATPVPSCWADDGNLLILCYHDIPKSAKNDVYGVDQKSFVQQIEYLRLHGYHFVSIEDVIRANRKEKKLPPKPVLLTFDDGYLSFYEFVFPLLKIYGIPSVLAVVAHWIDHGSPYTKLPLMNWEQLKEVGQSGLVEIASHTHNMHHGVVYNPQGNTGPAVSRRIYEPETKSYESESAKRNRLGKDFLTARRTLAQKAQWSPRVMVWPYGKYNQIAVEEAKKCGYDITFSLGHALASPHQMSVMPRFMIDGNPSITDFIKGVNTLFSGPVHKRIIHADLDLLYDTDSDQQQKNLDRFIDRIVAIKPSTVYLQAFSDAAGNGDIATVYFPNRVLPMKSDLFSYVANQLYIREIEVYAWMPMLSITLPDEEENRLLRVKERRDGRDRASTSWYKRLSPFSPKARRKLVMLYEDMAMSSRVHGVVFQDDGFLNDFEDVHPAALKHFRTIADPSSSFERLTPVQKEQWTQMKTKILIELTNELRAAILRYRPEADIARIVYAPTLTDPDSEHWLAQSYIESLKAYDYVVIMAYPFMEEVAHPTDWLKGLVHSAKQLPLGLDKTVFKIQTYDWKTNRPIATRTINKWLRALVASGAKHIAYYPDNVIDNHPQARIIRDMISVDEFPLEGK